MPELDEMVINLNDPQLTAKDIMAVTGLDEFFCKVVIKVRKGEAYDEFNLVDRIWNWYEDQETSPMAPDVFRSKNAILLSFIRQGKIEL